MVKSFVARKAVEKTRAGKVKNLTFPPRLEIPPTPAGFPLSHSFGCYCLPDEELSKKWGHFYFGKDGDTSILV